MLSFGVDNNGNIFISGSSNNGVNIRRRGSNEILASGNATNGGFSFDRGFGDLSGSGDLELVDNDGRVLQAGGNNPNAGGGGGAGSFAGSNGFIATNGANQALPGFVPFTDLFNPINTPNLPRVTTPRADQFGLAGQTRDFNTPFISQQFESAFSNAQRRAPDISALTRGLINDANISNQDQRIRSFDRAAPGGSSAILKNLRESQTLIDGRLPDSIQDRALDASIQSASAENANLRGLGDQSTFARKGAQLANIEQRLGLRDRGLNEFNTALGQASTFREAPQILEDPRNDFATALSFSQNEASSAIQAGTISPAQVINNEIGQNQFQSNLDQNRNFQQASNEINVDQFNASNEFQARLLELQQEQSFLDANTAVQQNAFNEDQRVIEREEAIQINREQQQAIQDAQQTSSIANLGTQLLGGLLGGGSSGGGLLGSIGSGIGNLFGLGGGGADGVVNGGILEQASSGFGNALESIGSFFGLDGGGQAIADATQSVLSDAGVQTIASGASIPTGFTAVGSASGGGTLVAPTSAVTSAGGAQPFLSGLGSSVLPTAGVAAGAYVGFQQASGLLSALDGERLDTSQKLALAGVTGGLSLVFDDVKQEFDKIFGTGKHGDQVARDDLRNNLETAGVLETIDGSHHVELADGSKFDVGQDGRSGTRQWHNASNLPEGVRPFLHAYDVDFTSDLALSTSLGGYALSSILLGGRDGQKEKIGGYFTNAAISQGNLDFNQENFSKSMANMRKIYETSGIKSIKQGTKDLNNLVKNGTITDSEYRQGLQGLDVVFNDNFQLAQDLMRGRR